MMLVAVAGGVRSAAGTGPASRWPRSSSKLDPLAGIGRVFSRQQLIDTLKASLLALMLGAIGALYLRRHVDAFAGVLGDAAAGRDRRGRRDAGGGLA